MNRGLLQGAAAFGIWGAFPLYWNLIRHVPTTQVMGHRIVWSCVVLAALVAATSRSTALAATPPRTVAIYFIAAVLIAANWTIYVWAVTSGFVVETSLGYFITPLVNVLLGVAVLNERLRRMQWAAVALATAGVLHLTIVYGAPPWIALGLASSFGSYGLIKKRAPLAPVEGLFLETVILAGPALLFLLMSHRSGDGVFLRAGTLTDMLLVGTGVLTVVPLLLFAMAVRRVPLSLMGILQFIAPTIQFFLGVFLFREAFTAVQLTGFAMVWAAVALFALDGGVTRRRAVPRLDEETA